MARSLKIRYPDVWYHVMHGGWKDEWAFKENEDDFAFIDLLKDIGRIWKTGLLPLRYAGMP